MSFSTNPRKFEVVPIIFLCWIASVGYLIYILIILEDDFKPFISCSLVVLKVKVMTPMFENKPKMSIWDVCLIWWFLLVLPKFFQRNFGFSSLYETLDQLLPTFLYVALALPMLFTCMLLSHKSIHKFS